MLADDDRDWHEDIAGGQYILRCGQVTIQQIGLKEDVRFASQLCELRNTDCKILQGHHAIVINVLHPGFFAYNPAYQRQLFDLMLLEGALLNIADTYVGSRPEDPITTKEKALMFKGEILEIANRIGLSAALEERKRSVHRIVTAIHSLRGLSRLVGMVIDLETDHET